MRSGHRRWQRRIELTLNLKTAKALGIEAAPRALGDELAPAHKPVVVHAPLFHLTGETRDLLLFISRPRQHATKNCREIGHWPVPLQKQRH
jgi:hypothetical protein